MDKNRSNFNKMRQMKIFLTIVLSTVGTFALIMIAIFLTLDGSKGKSNNQNKNSFNPTSINDGTDNTDGNDASGSKDIDGENLKTRTNVLVLGLDESGLLSDINMVVSFDQESGFVDIISIPRDTYCIIPPDRIQQMKDKKYFVPDDGVLKLTEIYNFSKSFAPEFTKLQIEELLGIKMDFYLTMTIKAFRNIIDAVDGVYFEVRQKGYDYFDGVYRINLPGGYQRLDGVHAEMLIRYRHDYANGDVDRINVQHEFMKAMFEQMLSKESLMKDPATVIQSIMSYVKTDMSIFSDVPRYISYFSKLSSDKIRFHTVNGEGRYLGAISYFFIDETALSATLEEIFFPKAADSRDKKIIVMNGAANETTGAKLVEKLTTAGYNAADGGSYKGSAMETARIVTKTDDNCDDLAKFFIDPVISQDALGIPEGYDIVIITGTNEK